MLNLSSDEMEALVEHREKLDAELEQLRENRMELEAEIEGKENALNIIDKIICGYFVLQAIDFMNIVLYL